MAEPGPWQGQELLECPFCGRVFRPDAQLVQLHIEQEHTDDSPFVVQSDGEYGRFEEDPDSQSQDGVVEADEVSFEYRGREEQERGLQMDASRGQQEGARPGRTDWVDEDFRKEFVQCPESECGEMVLLVDLNEHLDYHLAERTASSTAISRGQASLKTSHRTPFIPTSSGSFRMSDAKKLRRKPKASEDNRNRLSKGSSGHSSKPPSLAAKTIPSSSSKHASESAESLPPPSHAQNFSTAISPAIRSWTRPNVNERRRGSPSPAPSREEPRQRVTLHRRFRNLVSGWAPFRDKRPEDTMSKVEPTSGLRLGYTDLGPYAFEDRMPSQLWHQLEAGPRRYYETRITRDGRRIRQEKLENHHDNVVPRLAEMSDLDSGVREAWYCHPKVQHIVRYTFEGGFCGYRNIQMQISYILGARAHGHSVFPHTRIPTIPQLQRWIEEGWDNGVNEICREQMGKLFGTRKWIGPPEAATLYQQLGIPAAVKSCADDKDGRRRAHQVLYDTVEEYFRQDVLDDSERLKVHRTLRAPIFLQQPGHSLTIVGFERHNDGTRNIVVFDCAFNTSWAMRRYLEHKVRRPDERFIADAMRIYRRGSHQLRKYAEFELLMLTAEQPQHPAWDTWIRKR